MSTCLNCGKPVIQIEGRKEKKYCSERCRQKKWQADQKAIRAHVKEFGQGFFHHVIPTSVSATKNSDMGTTKTYEQYEADILASTYSGDLEKVFKAINKDPVIGAGPKAKLRVLADNHRTNFTN